MAGAVEVKLDTTQLRAAYTQAKQAGGGLTKDLRKGINGAAKPIADAVKANAPSGRIASAVEVKTSFSSRPSVKVQVNGKKAPNAAPINNGGHGGMFRHPVYGNRDVWVSQQADPFFDQPIKGAMAAADAAMVKALRDFEKRAGFT